MRGFLSPAVKAHTSEHQRAFRTLSRARRSKLAKAAQTTLLKIDQWARGQGVPQEVAEAIERAYAGFKAKKK
jgi:hypothetical protein